MEAILSALKFAASTSMFTLVFFIASVLFVFLFDTLRTELSGTMKARLLFATCLATALTLTWWISR